MSAAAAGAQLLVALLYAGLGVLAAVETVRERRHAQARALGVAFTAFAAVSAPLHAAAAVRLAGGEMPAAASSLWSALLLLGPLGVFAGLRVEALTGARAERTVRALPLGLVLAPPALAFLGGMVALAALTTGVRAALTPAAAALALALLATGAITGALMARAQEARRRERGGWAVSALTFAGIFPAAGYAQAMAVAVTPPAGPLRWLLLLALLCALGVLATAWRLHGCSVAAPGTRSLAAEASRTVRRSPWGTTA